MKRALVAVLLLLAAALAGCVGSVSTAKPLLSAAQDEARRWSPDAVLAGVVGIEISNGTELRTTFEQENGEPKDELRLVLGDDANPGDGRANGWGFIFQSPSRNTVLVVVLSGGRVVETFETGSALADVDVTSVVPIENWRIDSDEAWNIYKPNGVSTSFTASVLVGGDPGRSKTPFWLLYHQATERDDLEGIGIVDALNGTLLDLGSLLANLTLDLTARESGSVEGRLSLIEPTATHDFTIDLEHRRIAVAVAPALTGLPNQEGTLVVRGPGLGNGVVFLIAPTELMTPQRFLLPASTAGDYEATLQLASPPNGVLLDYVFSFCTDGIAFPALLGEPDACALL